MSQVIKQGRKEERDANANSATSASVNATYLKKESIRAEEPYKRERDRESEAQEPAVILREAITSMARQYTSSLGPYETASYILPHGSPNDSSYPTVRLLCNDTLGMLSYYMLEYNAQTCKFLVQNMSDNYREITIYTL